MSPAADQKPATHEVVVVTAGTLGTAAPTVGAMVAAPPDEVIAAARGLGLTLRPVFESSGLGLDTAAPAAQADPDLAAIEAEQARFLATQAPTAEEAQRAAQALRNLPGVETVYVKPAVEPPLAPTYAPAATGTIPDLSHGQGYLDPSPGGIDARHAWTLTGGRGAGVQLIDIEGGWTLEHVDLRGNSGGLIGGQPYQDAGWTNHGTAVLGIIRGDDNGFGVTGIAPEANFSVVSHGGLGSSRAIDYASGRLGPGDLLLLEMHRPGPRFGYAARSDQRGYIAVEWWPDDFLAIRRAVLRGIIVVEAAGNGAENLDDTFYDRPDPQFLAGWQNPFRGARDSGAILVGAGAPPSGQYGPDRARLDFSNYGSRLDCQGWGRGVVSTGYGDLYGGADDGHRAVAYTAQFSGTSSASPIVTGVLACLQGIARARGTPLTPVRARDLLRKTGAPQAASGLDQRIGNRPDLAELIRHTVPDA